MLLFVAKLRGHGVFSHRSHHVGVALRNPSEPLGMHFGGLCPRTVTVDDDE